NVFCGAGTGGVDAIVATGRADAGDIIERAVAIVVDPVTDLGRLGHRAVTHPHPVLTGVECSLAAHAAAAVLTIRERAGRAAGLPGPGIGQVVIDRAVAVVVDLVADFRRGADTAAADELPARAQEGARLALADAIGDKAARTLGAASAPESGIAL